MEAQSILSPSISIKFDIHSPPYPETFPRSLSSEEIDHFTHLSFQESFEMAQQSHLPYYSVTIVESGNNGIVESGNNGQVKFYKIYDTPHFFTHIVNQKKQNIPNTDPVTGQPVQKIHFFAVKCFEMKEDHLFKPVPLTSTSTLISLQTSSCLTLLFIDSFNANIIQTGKEAEKYRVRRMQFIISEFIKIGTVFPQLEPQERVIERMLWLWCSSKESYVSLLKLAKKYLNNSLSCSYSKLRAKEFLSKIPPHLEAKEFWTTRESPAITEGMALRTTLELESQES